MSRSVRQLRPEGALLAMGTLRQFSAKDVVYREGDPADHFLQVVEGIVRSTSVREDGRRFIDAFYVAGDVFGLELGTHYGRSAEAVCASSVVLYPSRDFAALETGKDGLAGQILVALMQELRQVKYHARLMAQASAAGKTSAFLLEWSRRSHMPSVLTLAMPRQDIADHMGLSVEALCRCLAQLNRDRLIETISARSFRLLDVPALQMMTA